MQAVILSAGKGVRLRPLTNRVPKVMVSVHGKPLLQWQIEYVKRFGVKEIFINLHYLHEAVRNFFGDGKNFGVRIQYSYEKRLLGTEGALFPFRNFLKGTFFLLYGDVFTNLDIKDVLRFHKKKQSDVTIVVRKTDHPRDSDLVRFADDSRLQRIYFKPHKALPSTQYGIAAIYMIESSMLQWLSSKKPCDIAKDFLPKLIRSKKRLFCYNTTALAKDIGTKERYNELLTDDYFKNASSD